VGYVKTPAEIAAIEELLSKGQFTIENLAIEFETTREFARHVLAPCFELADQPTGFVSVNRWQSALCGEFQGGIVGLNCKYKGQDGYTMLTLFIDNDMPVSIGREMWGEGKKRGFSELYVDGANAYGYTERNGTRLIQIEAEFGPEMGPQKVQNRDFELKAQPHTTGRGLQNNVVLSNFLTDEQYSSYREGTGTLKLQGTPWDPLDTVPVVSVGKAYLMSGQANWVVDSWDELPDPAAYVPYIYGQKYDDFTLFPQPKRFRAKK